MNVKQYKRYKYNSQEVMKKIQDKDNPIFDYLKNILVNNYNFYHADIERTKLHKKIMIYFGYDTDNKEYYYRSKHLLSNIRRMLAFATGSIGSRIINLFDIMLTTGVIDEKEIKTMTCLVTGFLMQPTTRAFMEDELDTINDISIWDLVFIEPIWGMHGYYKNPTYI